MIKFLKSAAHSGAGALSLLVTVLALGCSTSKAPAAGQLEIVTIEGGSRFDSPMKATFAGSLELRSLRDEALASIPIQGLSSGSRLRRELPAGLYSVTWTSDQEVSGPDSARMARDLPLVGIIAGQVTMLHVQQPEASSNTTDGCARSFELDRVKVSHPGGSNTGTLGVL